MSVVLMRDVSTPSDLILSTKALPNSSLPTTHANFDFPPSLLTAEAVIAGAPLGNGPLKVPGSARLPSSLLMNSTSASPSEKTVIMEGDRQT
ncbi:hypothetical protein PQ610_00900 [Tardisphaera miroshnichenkoae]